MATGFSLIYLLRARAKNLKRFVGSQLTTNLIHTIHHKKATLFYVTSKNLESKQVQISVNYLSSTPLNQLSLVINTDHSSSLASCSRKNANRMTCDLVNVY